jgi:hypothetical protein
MGRVRRRLRATQQAHRDYIASLVHDDVGLREVLLLSNDAQFGQFSR